MKHYLLTVLVLIASYSWAQPPVGGRGEMLDRAKEKQEKIQTLKVAFLTKELNLTSEEAEKFWPVHNKYTGELKDMMKNNVATDPLDRQQKALDIRKKYRNDFTRILSLERANKLFQMEDKFMSMVKKELENRRNPQMNRQRPMRQMRPGGQSRFR